MHRLTKKEIFERKVPLATEDVEFLGGIVTVQELTGTERDAFEASLVTFDAKNRRINNTHNVRARLLQKSIIDPDTGELMFAPAEVPALGMLPAKELDRAYEVAARLSGISAEAVETTAKNSEEIPGDDGASG